MQPQPNNLNTFKILFIIKGILNLFLALFFLAYAFFGSYFFSEFDAAASRDLEHFNPGWIFIIIGGLGFVFALIFGILTLIAGKYIGLKKNYSFVLVIAILNCLTGLLGILLGVFTIIELNKPHVKELFDNPS